MQYLSHSHMLKFCQKEKYILQIMNKTFALLYNNNICLNEWSRKRMDFIHVANILLHFQNCLFPYT